LMKNLNSSLLIFPVFCELIVLKALPTVAH
jgi:hypothetical protein